MHQGHHPAIGLAHTIAIRRGPLAELVYLHQHAKAGAALSSFPNSILRSVRRNVRDFVKIKYPTWVADRMIRGRIEAALPWVIWIPVGFWMG